MAIQAHITVKCSFLGVNNEFWAVMLPVCSTNMVYSPAISAQNSSNSQSYGHYTVWSGYSGRWADRARDRSRTRKFQTFHECKTFLSNFHPGKWPCKLLGISGNQENHTKVHNSDLFPPNRGGTPCPPPREYIERSFKRGHIYIMVHQKSSPALSAPE